MNDARMEFTADISRKQAFYGAMAAGFYTTVRTAHKPGQPYRLAKWMLLILAGMVSALLLDRVLEFVFAIVGEPISFVLGFFAGVFLFGLASLLLSRRAAHFFVPGVTSPISYVLDPSGVTARFSGVHNFIPWRSVDGWIEREASVLMLAAGTLFIMPYAALAAGRGEFGALSQIEQWRKAAGAAED